MQGQTHAFGDRYCEMWHVLVKHEIWHVLVKHEI